MSLKILILPTFIILEVIIAIGYIKPNIDGILGKQIEIQTAKDDLSKVDSVIANIQTVGRSIASRAEAVSFIEKYYPKKLDEERVVDMFNFLAQQSGIIVTGVVVTADPEIKVGDAVYNDAVNSGVTPETATLMAEAATLAAPKSYTAKVTVIGGYTNIKDFFSKIHHSDRLHETDEFAIEYRKQDPNKAEEEAAVGIQNNFLIGTLRAKFPYVGQQQAGNALNDPLFQSSTFNFKPAEQVISFVTNPLPPLEGGQGGRENPFE
jgi:hypothetical protein